MPFRNGIRVSGIVISRRATGSSFERRLILASSFLICVSSTVSYRSVFFRMVHVLSGKMQFGSSTRAIRLAARLIL
jgi:hypothetical protein